MAHPTWSCGFSFGHSVVDIFPCIRRRRTGHSSSEAEHSPSEAEHSSSEAEHPPSEAEYPSREAQRLPKEAEHKSREKWRKRRNMRFQTRSLRFQSPGLRIVSWPESPQIDIVFVHGPRDKHKTDWIKDGTFWPQDLLANDLGDARIACWEYKREEIECFEAMGGTAMEFADDMCNALFHVGGYGPRPLIFIAHDLGGLLVQMSLANARIGGYTIRESVRNTHAVLFFGLPGTIQKQVQLLEAFMRESCVLPDRTLRGLERLNSGFWGAVAESNIKLAYCNPTRRCSGVCGSGLRKLDSSFLKNEGQLNQPNRRSIEVEVISIPTCHCAMTKFSGRKDPGYSKIVDLLQTWSNGPVPG